MPVVQWRVVIRCWCDVVCVVCCWDVLDCEWWDERCCLQWMHDTWDVCEYWVVDVLSVQWRMVIDDWSDGMHVVCCWDVLECERCHQLGWVSGLWCWDVLIHRVLDMLQVRCWVVV